MEFDTLFVGLAPAGGADGGGFFVEGGAVFVEQDLLLLELCREEEVFGSRAGRASGADSSVSSPPLTAKRGLRRS